MKYLDNKQFRLGRKHGNFPRNINHIIAKEIVGKAKEYKLV